MQAAAMNPQYILRENITQATIDKELEITVTGEERRQAG